MRDFEQRKAEIFRRSEERLTQRKHRRRMIISCVPLVICIAVLSVVHVPDLIPTINTGGKSQVEENKDTSSVQTDETKSYSAVKVQARSENTEYYREFEEPESVEKIVNTIEKYNCEKNNASASTEAETDYDNAAAGGATMAAELPEEDKKEDGYRITVVSSDGSERVYTIADGYLRDLTNGKKVFLTKEQVSEISSLLEDFD